MLIIRSANSFCNHTLKYSFQCCVPKLYFKSNHLEVSEGTAPDVSLTFKCASIRKISFKLVNQSISKSRKYLLLLSRHLSKRINVSFVHKRKITDNFTEHRWVKCWVYLWLRTPSSQETIAVATDAQSTPGIRRSLQTLSPSSAFNLWSQFGLVKHPRWRLCECVHGGGADPGGGYINGSSINRIGFPLLVQEVGRSPLCTWLATRRSHTN